MASRESDGATTCAVCGEYKHTPLRRDEMGGYVCLTCVDNALTAVEEERCRLRDVLNDARILERDRTVEIVGNLRKRWIKRQYEWSAISWADKVTAADQIIAALQEAGDESNV